jgi:cytochrome c biogenesis protein CcmG/thiol:disulfide interchange protein DsbE
LLDRYYRAAASRGWPLKIFAVATEDSLPKSVLKPLFAALAIPSADRIRGGPFGDVDAVPTNYVIDRAGVLRYAKSGSFDLDDLNTILVPLMQESAPVQ